MFGMFPPVIKFILMLNVAVFILQYLVMELLYFGGLPLSAYFFNYFALQTTNFSFSFAENSFWPWQLITFQFMHGGLWHLFFNMFAIWMFGIELENSWGSRRFLFYYLLTGIGAGLVQLAIHAGPTIGASGGVFGVLLAFGMLNPDRKIFIFPIFIPIKAKYFVMIYAGIELFLGITGSSDGIAHLAHVGGAATGFLLIKFGDQLGIYKFLNSFVKSFGVRGTSAGYSQFGGYYGHNDRNPYGNRPQPRQEATRYKVSWEKTSTNDDYEIEETDSNSKSYIINGEEITQQTIDSILDKISASGYQNLSEREKIILNELSKRL
ncbi:MAG: rhomboid family intramembrane serine protease [Ignavibacteriae bacterium]|nr:rhomboid family intramembrane serine protease [Ignavibacteriota bacterium]MCB9220374.1 rhomboid family intramembrane serine protease [Ignavibacteria bacterium]